MTKSRVSFLAGSPVIRPERVEGVVFDFDDTITSPFTTIRGHRVRLHDISRVLTSKILGLEWKNEFLLGLTPEVSAQSYAEAAEPTIEGSVAWLFKQAGIFDDHIDYDRADSRLQEFVELRSKQHLQVLKDYAQLNPGAADLIRYVSENTEYGAAVASMAILNQIDVVFDKYNLSQYIPESRIITSEHARRPKPDREVNDLAYHTLKTRDDDFNQRQRIIGIDDTVGGITSIAGARLYPIALAVTSKIEGFNGSQARAVFTSMAAIQRLIVTTNKSADAA